MAFLRGLHSPEDRGTVVSPLCLFGSAGCSPPIQITLLREVPESGLPALLESVSATCGAKTSLWTSLEAAEHLPAEPSGLG
ncbi:Potassium/Sodium Hyperpolarization-Activated Cyclic Nucleotide-Gated Channel 1 [Manis pentadactyla]|nr:Potassium/Sodium Hyperpolarization-Activated Cyclic Nucleotide-Gated Channel 1 [Manis pentadactyla]